MIDFTGYFRIVPAARGHTCEWFLNRLMLSKRYAILLADRDTGVTRRFTISRRAIAALLVAGCGAAAVLLLVGLGARWGARADLARLEGANRALRLENDSFRAVTGELANQISSLQGVVAELGDRSAVDAAQRKAMAALPDLVRHRAMGGARPSAREAVAGAALGFPEDTFGVLRDLLGALENRLRVVRTDAERWQALAEATPSIWPVVGWLSDGFGRRQDPFTGEAAQHQGLDISADRGDAVHATANGTVVSASYHQDFGNLVVVGHEFGLTTRYAHLARLNVQAGQTVQRGDVVGFVGSTGRSTAPHLHYEVWANGRPINPLKLLAARPDR